MWLGAAFTGLPAAAVVALAAAGVAALTALYLLRRRPQRTPVPFLQLWLAEGGSRRAERLARRLRRLLSLALQLLVFGLLVAAAADPRPAVEPTRGRSVVVLIDRSASMAARDEPGSRLGRALALARAAIDGLGPEDQALLATFAADTTALTGFERDPKRLVPALATVTAAEEPGDPRAALAFAGSLLRGRPRPTLILVGDGAPGDGAGDAGGTGAAADPSLPSATTGDGDLGPVPAELRGVDVRFAGVGRRRDNLALVAFSARRLPADPSSVEAAVAIQSFRSHASDVTMEITSGPAGILVARRRLHLAPGARQAEVLADVAAPDGRLTATLIDAKDDLPLDDRAFAVIPEPRRLGVLVVGATNLYLEGALLSLGTGVRIERAPSPGAVDDARLARHDVVILDGTGPVPPPTAGRFLYLDPHGPESPWTDRGGGARDPVVSDVDRDHPLLKHVSLTDLNVGVARRLALAPGDRAVASALGVPLLVARERPGLRQVALAFDVRRSDLPLRSAFPLLLANALGWLADRPRTEALSFPTGRTVEITLPAAAPPAQAAAPGQRADQRVTIEAPDGRRRAALLTTSSAAVSLDRVGLYEMTREEPAATPRRAPGLRIAANLASVAESDTRPRRVLRLGGRALPEPDPPRPQLVAWRRAPWRLLAGAALVLLLLEWISLHRRLTI
jgi:Ca-activated chloride channel homolog